MHDVWKDHPELGERLSRVAALMEATVRDPSFPLAEGVASLLAGNGKMLRPAFLVLGARFGKPDWARIERLAAAVELLHVSTLIHDDVLDDADLRRGVPTLHARFGAKEAVLAGDWLFSRCFRLAAESAAPGGAEALARLVGAICSAEIAQDLAKWSYSPSLRAYERKIAGKTAALFSLALHTGASESKAPRGQVERLRRAGYDIGMAFQVIDDVLDYESSEGAMGKPVGKDLREGLCTLPLIFALRRDPARMEALLAAIPRPAASPTEAAAELEGRARAAVAAVIEAARELGAVEAAREEARRYTARALREIGLLPPGPAREELRIVTERLLSRAS